MWMRSEIAAARILYIEGYLWDDRRRQGGLAQGDRARRRARAAQVALSLSDSFCVGRFRDEFLHLLDNDLDILFANEDEAKALFEAEDFRRRDRSAEGLGRHRRPHALGQGLRHRRGRQVHAVPAAPVAQVIDTTGAGDQFAAGFLYGLTHGKGLADCGRLGALAAAEVISHYGARPETSLKELAAKAGLI